MAFDPRDTPPAADEFELTVFGPGVGECIVLHLGDGVWVVVDSCIEAATGLPIALRYLSSLGIEAGKAVRMIVATHWHDDHIGGIAKLLDECLEAQFVMSAALATQEFASLVLEVDAAQKLVAASSSASEFASVFEILRHRRRSRWVNGPHVFAQDGTRLFVGGFRNQSEIWALSPSAATITNCHAGLANRLLTSSGARRFKRFSPNDLSVALCVCTGGFHAVLGADLENTSAADFGWKAIIASPRRPTRPAGAFKISHHGSVNADHDDIWAKMLTTNPVAVVTPYAKLAEPLPTSADLRRIQSRTTEAFCTTWPSSTKPDRRKNVDANIHTATKTRRIASKVSGYVRIRLDLSAPTSSPRVSTFGSAKRVEAILD